MIHDTETPDILLAPAYLDRMIGQSNLLYPTLDSYGKQSTWNESMPGLINVLFIPAQMKAAITSLRD